MIRPVNAAGSALLRSSEGCRLYTYDDATGLQIRAGDEVSGRLTAGYGHTGSDVVPGMAVTQARAAAWAAADLAACAADVQRLVAVPLNDNQFAALCVFRFNIGPGAFAGSTLLRLLNAGRYDAVPVQLARWTMANGAVVPGLAARRAREAALFATPVMQGGA